MSCIDQQLDAEAETEKLKLSASEDGNGDLCNFKATLADDKNDYGLRIASDKLDVTSSSKRIPSTGRRSMPSKTI
ncbi:hypothetical protein N7523_010575 [Penicillium sp. IBT 18751x]|nr:hypothetical protein N7523_010575 [Penicillium sp. IBT 18751x]